MESKNTKEDVAKAVKVLVGDYEDPKGFLRGLNKTYTALVEDHLSLEEEASCSNKELLDLAYRLRLVINAIEEVQ